MRIAIVAPSPVPVVEGGAERLWRSLAGGLNSAGHDAEIVTLPFPETTLAEVIDGYDAFRNLDLSDFDVVITGKYPAWIVEHPCHVVYMLHPLRGLYDTYPESLDLALPPEHAGLERAIAEATTVEQVLDLARKTMSTAAIDDPLAAHPSPLGRALVHRLDTLAFEGDRIQLFAAISDEVASRPHYFPTDRAVQVVHPVSDLPAAPAQDGASSAEGPVLFTASRHDEPKRIDLIIRAFRHLTDGHNDRQLSLVIAGDGPQRTNLEQLAGANERIEFVGRISEAELARRYQSADAVVFIPDHEDFGYVTLEAMMAGTPVITTHDAGGAKELLSDGVGGIITEPSEAALAEAFDRLADNPRLRWQLGLNGKRRARAVSWHPLIASIESRAGSASRPRAVMVSTFGVDPMVGGGQRRLRYLARALARHVDVTILALTPQHDTETVRRRIIDPGITQVEVPRSVAHLRAESEITRVAGIPVDDITCGRLWSASPNFAPELDRLLHDAAVVIADHPFLSPAIADRLDALALTTPLIYDSHNAETPFKRDMLNDVQACTDAARAWLVETVDEAERIAVRRAQLVTACTNDDLLALRPMAAGLEREQHTVVVPNGVDTSALTRRTDDERTRARTEILGTLGFNDDEPRPLAFFVGSWHPPNLDAARLVLELAALRPDWIFGLAGSHTLAFQTGPEAIPPNVRLLSQFAEESLWPLIAGSDVALNPMASGGGSNLKLYDYLAVGLPVLTTEKGSRGLDEAGNIVWVVDPTSSDLANGLDAISQSSDDDIARRIELGRSVAELADWTALGDRWSRAVLTASSIQASATAASDSPTQRPFLATDVPPPANPTIELMDRLTQAALDPSPPLEMTTMNPNLRENLKRMRANRHAGRVLPSNARLKLPKKALIRAGQAITNEQSVFNEATVDAVSQLTDQVAELENRLASLEKDS